MIQVLRIFTFSVGGFSLAVFFAIKFILKWYWGIKLTIHLRYVYVGIKSKMS